MTAPTETSPAVAPQPPVRPPSEPERNHTLPSALRSEANFLNRRFAAFARDLTLAATELEELRSEVAYLRAGILQAIENEDDRLTVLRELHASPAHTSVEKIIG